MNHCQRCAAPLECPCCGPGHNPPHRMPLDLAFDLACAHMRKPAAFVTMRDRRARSVVVRDTIIWLTWRLTRVPPIVLAPVIKRERSAIASALDRIRTRARREAAFARYLGECERDIRAGWPHRAAA